MDRPADEPPPRVAALYEGAWHIGRLSMWVQDGYGWRAFLRWHATVGQCGPEPGLGPDPARAAPADVLRDFFPAALEAFADLDAPDALELLAAAPKPDRAAV